jgi:hypothetical protein
MPKTTTPTSDMVLSDLDSAVKVVRYICDNANDSSMLHISGKTSVRMTYSSTLVYIIADLQGEGPIDSFSVVATQFLSQLTALDSGEGHFTVKPTEIRGKNNGRNTTIPAISAPKPPTIPKFNTKHSFTLNTESLSRVCGWAKPMTPACILTKGNGHSLEMWTMHPAGLYKHYISYDDTTDYIYIPAEPVHSWPGKEALIRIAADQRIGFESKDDTTHMSAVFAQHAPVQMLNVSSLMAAVPVAIVDISELTESLKTALQLGDVLHSSTMLTINRGSVSVKSADTRMGTSAAMTISATTKKECDILLNGNILQDAVRILKINKSKEVSISLCANYRICRIMGDTDEHVFYIVTMAT